MNYFPLSKMPPLRTSEEAINYLEAKQCEGIVNDLNPKYSVEYDTADILLIWDDMRNAIENMRKRTN